MGVQHVGSFLILSASAQSLTPTLKLICSLIIFFLEKITHKLIDQSKTSGSGRELCEFRVLGTNQRAAPHSFSESVDMVPKNLRALVCEKSEHHVTRLSVSKNHL